MEFNFMPIPLTSISLLNQFFNNECKENQLRKQEYIEKAYMPSIMQLHKSSFEK